MKYIRRAVIAGALFLIPAAAAAQSPTPEIQLSAPSPSQCTVAPIMQDRLTSLAGSASPVVALETPNTEAATPTPFVAPEGTPVNDDVAAEVEPVVVQYYACQNANDQLRLMALYTDRYLAHIVSSGDIAASQLTNMATPQPARLASEQLVMAIYGIIEVEPGVYGVDVVGVDQAAGAEFTDHLIVVRSDDQLRIDKVERLIRNPPE